MIFVRHCQVDLYQPTRTLRFVYTVTCGGLNHSCVLTVRNRVVKTTGVSAKLLVNLLSTSGFAQQDPQVGFMIRVTRINVT